MNADDVVASINPQEVVDLALALGNIESGTGLEGEAGQYVYDWLGANGFKPKKYALIENRFNVAAWIRGSGGGYSLVFNSHLDTSMRRDSIKLSDRLFAIDAASTPEVASNLARSCWRRSVISVALAP